MGAAANAKQLRRDIRRSFGKDAFDEIVQMRTELSQLRSAVEADGRERTKAHHALIGRLNDAEAKANDLRLRTWRERLRWLVFGR